MADYAKGDLLLQMRKAVGVSRERVAAEIGVTTKTVFTWEKENGGIKPDNVRKLADYYGVDDPGTLIFSSEEGGDQLQRIEDKLDAVLRRLDEQDADAVERDEAVAALLAALRDEGSGETARGRRRSGS